MTDRVIFYMFLTMKNEKITELQYQQAAIAMTDDLEKFILADMQKRDWSFSKLVRNILEHYYLGREL